MKSDERENRRLSWWQGGPLGRGFIAEFVGVCAVIIALAATGDWAFNLLEARYEARLLAGLQEPGSPAFPIVEDSPDVVALLERLHLPETLSAPIAPEPLPEVAAGPIEPPRLRPVVAEAPRGGEIEQPALILQPGIRASLRSSSSIPQQPTWLSDRYRPGNAELVSIVAAGDVMMGSNYPSRADLDPDLIEGTDAASVIGIELAEIFRRADIAFVNFEGTLYDGAAASAKSCGNCFSFKSPEFYAGILASLGIDVASLANNHSGDFGDSGRTSTVAALRNAGIAVSGLQRADARTASLILPDGKRIGVVAFAPNLGTLSLNDVQGAETVVRRLKDVHDLVLVSFHGGAEGWNATRVPQGRETYLGENRGSLRDFSHRMIDAGAAMVIGHGPHVPRAIEIYRGHLVAYSLGNFWTRGAIQNYAVSGLGPVVEAWLAPDGTLAGMKIHSIRQAGLGVPSLDPLDEAARYVDYLTRRDFPATAALISRRARIAVDRSGVLAMQTPPPDS